MLRAAAVIGYEFDVDLLAVVVGRDSDAILDALDTSSAAGLVIEVGVDRHRFAHALVRETLHGELSASRRARQHRKVAEALEARHVGDLDAVVADLATHWAEASAGGDPGRAIELAIRAGAQANERGAWENAIRWNQNALELMEDQRAFDGERRQALVSLAGAQAISGAIPDARRTLVAAARLALQAGDLDAACAALRVDTHSSFEQSNPANQHPEKVALVRAVLATPSLTDALRADLLSELSIELIYENDIPGRRAAIDELWAMLPSLNANDHARILQNTSLMLGRISRSRLEILDLFDKAIQIARPDQMVRLHLNRLWFGFLLGRRQPVDESAGVLQRMVAKTPSRHQWNAWLPTTMLRVLDGDLAGASVARREMIRLLEVWAVVEGPTFRLLTQFMIRREQRTLSGLSAHAEMLQQMGPPSSAVGALGAYIRFASGDTVGLSSGLDMVRVDEIAEDGGWHVVVALWSEIAGAIGTDRQRRSFVELLLPLAGVQHGTGGIYFGAADRLRAVLLDRLGNHEQADALWADAVRQHEDFRTPTWVARTQLDWAESLLRRNSREASRHHLDAAATSLSNLDLPDNQRRLAELRSRLSAGG